ncbi:alpha/beta hydrolase-fold protein [Agromyces sp. NPDC058484]|uniref:alpha/beta hydrolase-fold protein n=1 Tax=Agromyces sp. NPDC058484 TaxID=3346524 RepID=UPI0036676765
MPDLVRDVDLVGGTGILQGTFDNVEGTFDNVEGTFDNVDGAFDNIEGTSDAVEGTFDAVEGTFDLGEGTTVWHLVLDVSVVDGPFLITMCLIAAAFFIYLLGRGDGWSWVLTAIVVLVVGAIVGGGILWVAVNVLDSFGGPVADDTWLWISAAFAGIALAIWNLWHSRWWRKLIAVVAIPVFSLTAMFGINAAYGLDPTLGALLGISTADTIDVDPPGETAAADPAEPLYLTWTPPPDMPATGTIGIVGDGVPNTNSGFPARPAQLYLPPAALVTDAPRLPLVIMMMGQPGDPEASFIGAVLDGFAAEHDGLAPIALVVDQLGDPAQDPLCLDTDLGDVETYLMQDVVPWARANLNVLQGRQFTTVAGYSNGGGCAAYFGAKHPDVFGNLLAISPVEFAGAERRDDVLASAFDGDKLAYNAVKPANIMAAMAPYPDTTAIFTVGANDGAFVPGTQRLADAALAAGMATTFFLVPDADHGVSGLNGGLEKGFEVLYPRLGLSER